MELKRLINQISGRTGVYVLTILFGLSVCGLELNHHVFAQGPGVPDQTTPGPQKTPKPGKTPKPKKTPKPGKTPKPAKTPKPKKTPKPGKTPKPAKTPKPGKAKDPFKASAKSAKDLEKILDDKKASPAEKQAAQSEIDMLVNQAANQAMMAVNAAIGAGGDPKKIEKAQKALDEALKKIAKGDFSKAIDEYRKAYEEAQKSLK